MTCICRETCQFLCAPQDSVSRNTSTVENLSQNSTILLNYYLKKILTTPYACKFRELLRFPQIKILASGRHMPQLNRHESMQCRQSIVCLHTTPIWGKEKWSNNKNSKKTLHVSLLQWLLSPTAHPVLATALELLGKAGWAEFSHICSSNLQSKSQKSFVRKRKILTITYGLLLRFQPAA